MTDLDLFEATLRGEATPHLPCQPITMRFASHLVGRPFYEYIHDYRVMAAGQLAMVEQYGVDCVQVISDPAREVDDLGGRPTYFPDEAPINEAHLALIQEPADLKKLRLPDPLGGGRMHDRVKAVALLRERVGPEMSVQGWVEGPMAMAADLHGLQPALMASIEEPGFMDDLFAFSVDMEIAFAKAQVEAGADLVGVGDAAASLLSPRAYHAQVFAHEERLIHTIQAMGVHVRLHICGDTTHLAPDLGRLGVDMIDIDYPCDFAHARRECPTAALLGNMNPTEYLFRGTPETVWAKLSECHAAAGARFVVGAGCEVPTGSPAENVRAMCGYARANAGVAAV
ncbi:MAG: hypothetical protein HYU66_20930 [Armatimonadetes bacterium]|nr:hypothetical protein [Armatimonadota bacterium]